MKLKIRQAKLSDSEVISNLALSSKAYWGYSPDFINACRQELTFFPQDIQNNHFFVAEIDSLIIGFYGLEVLSNTKIELMALFIAPSHIHRGYGHQLMEHAKFIARKLGGQEIIIQGDPHAIPFYLKVGGKLIGQKESLSIPGRYLPVFMINLII